MALLYLLSTWLVAGVACWTTFVAFGLRFVVRPEAVGSMGAGRMAA
ncbi:MAG: hypothetical protein R3253_06825 [Longimicrobiales bacterium]|nr:hypothetical protein [Longimicrobiales bacterium]